MGWASRKAVAIPTRPIRFTRGLPAALRALCAHEWVNQSHPSLITARVVSLRAACPL